MKYEETKIKEKAKEICEENYPFCSDCPFSEYTGYDEEGNPDNECIFNCSNNEKTAEQMFKELGYERLDGTLFGFIKYVNLNSIPNYYGAHNSIFFNLKEKKIRIEEAQDFRVIQAINQQVKELGWLDKE